MDRGIAATALAGREEKTEITYRSCHRMAERVR